MAKKRKYTKSNSRGNTRKSKRMSNIDLTICILIVLSILLGFLIYTNSGVIGVKLNEILGGMVDLVWIVRENGELLLGAPWGTYSRRLIDNNYRIKKPIIGTYEDLEEILKITFKMYEDFKSTLTGN